jgi:signal transduction histidine kinase
MSLDTTVFQKTFSGEGIHRSDNTLAVPVISPSGEVIGGLFFGHSQPGMFTEEHEKLLTGISSQAAVAIDNAKLYEEVKTLNTRKDEFIGVAGHELRTPITTIKGYLQLLEEKTPEGLTKDFIEKALRQVNKLNRLITDLLDVTRIHAGKLDYTKSRCSLIGLVKECIETVCQIHTSHVIESRLSDGDLIVMVDPTKIEQVLINFLINAIKYSPGQNRIFVQVIREPGRAVVSVRDSGIGIPKQHLINIFHRYYRVSHSQYVIAGLGMGLYISKEIIDRHNGSMWVESEEGKGSTFYFALPLA